MWRRSHATRIISTPDDSGDRVRAISGLQLSSPQPAAVLCCDSQCWSPGVFQSRFRAFAAAKLPDAGSTDILRHLKVLRAISPPSAPCDVLGRGFRTRSLLPPPSRLIPPQSGVAATRRALYRHPATTRRLWRLRTRNLDPQPACSRRKAVLRCPGSWHRRCRFRHIAAPRPRRDVSTELPRRSAGSARDSNVPWRVLSALRWSGAASQLSGSRRHPRPHLSDLEATRSRSADPWHSLYTIPACHNVLRAHEPRTLCPRVSSDGPARDSTTLRLPSCAKTDSTAQNDARVRARTRSACLDAYEGCGQADSAPTGSPLASERFPRDFVMTRAAQGCA